MRDKLLEWKKSLVIAVTGLFFFETITGLFIYFGPFSLFNQFSVLLHTVVGLVWMVPYTIYQLVHWLGVRENRFSHFKLLGYSSWVAISVCAISGIVLTVQSTWGIRISYVWRLTHIVSCFASLALLLVHLITVWVAHRKGDTSNYLEGIRKAQWIFLNRSIAWMAAMFVLTLGAMFLYHPIDTSYQLPKDYSYRYGQGRPFAPSLVKTSHGGAINPRALAESERCGTAACHAEIVKEWLPSSHRYASMDKAFQVVQKVMAQNEGAESTRYCGGCHDPIALFSGSKNIYSEDLSSYGANEGVSCVVCHSITKTDVKGNAAYTIQEPVRYAFELKEGKTAQFLSDFLIRAYPDHHVSSFTRDLYKTPEYCAACHKQFIDQEINKVGWVQLQNQFDNWKASHWNTGRSGNEIVTCRECHMPLMDTSTDPAHGDAQDYNRNTRDGKHRSHRFVAANQLMPVLLKLPGWKKHYELTEKWLQGKYPIPEIAHKWVKGAAVDLTIEGPDQVRPGQELTYKVIVRNNKVGHDFPTGPLDIIQAWVDTEVSDGNGKVLYHSGRVTNEHFLEKNTFIFKAEGIDKEGNLIDRHNLWEMIGARFRRAIFPGFSDAAEYALFCPDLTKTKPKGKPFALEESHRAKVGKNPSKLIIKARLRYRKIDQYLLNYVFGVDSGLTSPITDMTKAEKIVKVALAK